MTLAIQQLINAVKGKQIPFSLLDIEEKHFPTSPSNQIPKYD